MRKILSILILVLTALSAHAQQEALPVVRLTGTFGNDYQAGTFELIDDTTTITMDANIKWRGGTTNAPDKHKRNYKIKLSADTTLLGMRHDDSWILDAGQADPFRLRNLIAMELWNDMSHRPYYIDKQPEARNGFSGRVVEVYLNDEYQGIYNLMENIDRKQMKLKKVLNGQVRGCLYKVKHYGYGNMNDTVDIYDNHSDTWEYIEAKYPDLNDNDTTDWSTLYNALNFVTFSSDEEFAAHVDEYFDIPVVIDMSIFIGIIGGLDNRGKNILWAVYDKTKDKKLTPVPWDLDCSIGQYWIEEKFRGPEILFDWQIGLTTRLCKDNVNGFNDSLNARYKELRQGVLATDSVTGRYRRYYELLKRTGAAEREQQRWSGDSDISGREINFDQEIDSITTWITSHLEWIDQAWYPLDAWTEWWESQQETAMQAPQRPFNRQTDTFYTLTGQRVQNTQKPRPGIYIRNGRKIIIRF